MMGDRYGDAGQTIEPVQTTTEAPAYNQSWYAAKWSAVSSNKFPRAQNFTQPKISPNM